MGAPDPACLPGAEWGAATILHQALRSPSGERRTLYLPPALYLLLITTPCLAGLAIDYPESKLYWISSGNGTISRCNLDGTGLEVLDTMKGQLSKATALAIMGEHWTRATGCRGGVLRLCPLVTHPFFPLSG